MKFKILIFFLLLTPISLRGKETELQKIQQKYLLSIDVTPSVSQALASGLLKGDKETHGVSMFPRVYQFFTDQSYELVKENLETKELHLREMTKSDFLEEKQNFQATNPKIKKDRNPWELGDYRLSMGVTVEGWKVVLENYHYDTIEYQWVKKTTVRFVETSAQRPASRPRK